jgi:hypothetical protein
MLLAREVYEARERGETVGIYCLETTEKQFKRHLEVMIRGIAEKEPENATAD